MSPLRVASEGISDIMTIAIISHTGRDEKRSYGTKTRECQMDTVLFQEVVKREDTDVSFDIEFRKARERTPATRSDFRSVRISHLLMTFGNTKTWRQSPRNFRRWA